MWTKQINAITRSGVVYKRVCVHGQHQLEHIQSHRLEISKQLRVGCSFRYFISSHFVLWDEGSEISICRF